jgi:urease gamma subunit
MTQLLEQALAEVQKLPPAEQDAIAAIILDELADERRWEGTFARSQEQLARLANRVRDDIRAGRVRNVEMDEL